VAEIREVDGGRERKEELTGSPGRIIGSGHRGEALPAFAKRETAKMSATLKTQRSRTSIFS
jgi:hypothetical protein